MGDPLGSLRRRLVDRDGHPLQVASISARSGPGMGNPDAALGHAQERDDLSPGASHLSGWRAPGDLPRLDVRDAGGARGAAPESEPRGETVRYRRVPDRSERRSPDQQRRLRRRRPGREVRHHPEPHRGPHLQHRLRPGGGRRATGEPDAFLPVLSRETGVLPGEPGDLRLRKGRDQLPRWGRGAAPWRWWGWLPGG